MASYRGWSVKDYTVDPIGRRRQTGYRGVLTHPEVEGWELVVDTGWTPTGGDRIRRLELRAVLPAAELSGEQIRLITPRAILAAMNDKWILEGDPIVVPEPLPSGSRTRRTAEYLFQLSEAAVSETHESMREALARKFGRSSSQIRDDLLRATKLGLLEPSGPGKRSRVAGPKLLKQRAERATKNGTEQ